jgi:hypothetical protein
VGWWSPRRRHVELVVDCSSSLFDAFRWRPLPLLQVLLDLPESLAFRVCQVAVDHLATDGPTAAHRARAGRSRPRSTPPGNREIPESRMVDGRNAPSPDNVVRSERLSFGRRKPLRPSKSRPEVAKREGQPAPARTRLPLGTTRDPRSTKPPGLGSATSGRIYNTRSSRRAIRASLETGQDGIRSRNAAKIQHSCWSGDWRRSSGDQKFENSTPSRKL